jgi:hypothetical protein
MTAEKSGKWALLPYAWWLATDLWRMALQKSAEDQRCSPSSWST